MHMKKKRHQFSKDGRYTLQYYAPCWSWQWSAQTERIYTDADLDRSLLTQSLGTNERYVTVAISACTKGKSVPMECRHQIIAKSRVGERKVELIRTFPNVSDFDRRSR